MKKGMSSEAKHVLGSNIRNRKKEITAESKSFFSMASVGCLICHSVQKIIRYLPSIFFLVSVSCLASEITQAGFAFSGDYKTAAQRFPYTFELFKRIQAEKNASRTFSFLVNERSKGLKNPEIEFHSSGDLVNLKNSDRALMSVLVLTGETVATENYGTYYKTFVNLRGDALIFDYKNQTVVRSYPLSVVLFDATPEKPTTQRITGFVDHLIRREDGRGLVTQYIRRLASVKLPKESVRTVQVKQGSVTPEALSFLPSSLQKNPQAVQAMLTEGFASILSAKLNVPMLPSSVGHAGGVMSMRLENGDDYKLKVGEGDYLFDVKLNKFAKIQTSKSNVGSAYVYGTYMTVRFYEPALNTEYINTDLKNGEVAIVPAGQISGDDFAGYQDAMRGLALKFADAFKHPDSDWLNKAASAKNIKSQMKTADEIIRKCQ